MPKIKIDESRREVFVHDKETALSPKEYALLLALVRSNKAMTRPEISREIGINHEAYPRLVDQHIARLRAKLNGLRGAVRTVSGHGYKAMPSFFSARV